MNSSNKRWILNFLRVLKNKKNHNLSETSSTLSSADSKIATSFKPKLKSTPNKPQLVQPQLNQRKKKMLKILMTGPQDMETMSQLTMLNMENTMHKDRPPKTSLKLLAQPLLIQRRRRMPRTLTTGLQDTETTFQHIMPSMENIKLRDQQPPILFKRKTTRNQAPWLKSHQKRKKESPPTPPSKLLLISKEKKLIN